MPTSMDDLVAYVLALYEEFGETLTASELLILWHLDHPET